MLSLNNLMHFTLIPAQTLWKPLKVKNINSLK